MRARSPRPTWALVALAATLTMLAACGADPTRQRAVDALHLTAHALDLVDETSGSEVLSPVARDAIEPARADAHQWLERAQESMDTWTDGTSSLAFQTMIPCLGRSLGTLRERLARHDRPIPESLRRAEAITRSAIDRPCATRRRRRARSAAPEVSDER